MIRFVSRFKPRSGLCDVKVETPLSRGSWRLAQHGVRMRGSPQRHHTRRRHSEHARAEWSCPHASVRPGEGFRTYRPHGTYVTHHRRKENHAGEGPERIDRLAAPTDRRHRIGNSAARGADARGARCRAEGRHREIVADHQGRRHQGGVTGVRLPKSFATQPSTGLAHCPVSPTLLITTLASGKRAVISSFPPRASI
jgi:hypothetical protein